ncbi:MAG: hypothetical protein WKF91_11600 [Segetibacter sp.]
MAGQTPHQQEERILTVYAAHSSKYRTIIPFEALGIEKKYIAYWRREGLLPFMQKGKNAKLNFFQTIWVLMLNTVRNFQLPLETMKKLTAYFMQRAYDDGLPKKTVEYTYKKLQDTGDLRPLTPLEVLLLGQANFSLHRKLYLQAYQWDVNYFSTLIIESIMNEQEGGILVFEDGEIAEHLGPVYRTASSGEVDASKPHIYILISHYLKMFIGSPELVKFIEAVHLLDQDEERVLQELQSDNIKSIRIVTKGDKPLRIDSPTSGILSGEQKVSIQNVLVLRGYLSIALETRDGKAISFKKASAKR